MTVQPSHLDIGSGGDRTLVLTGVVDSHTAPRLLERLKALGVSGDIVLDVTAVEFIDSSGLRAIVSTHGALADVGRRLVLSGTSDAVDRILEITGLDGHIHRA